MRKGIKKTAAVLLLSLTAFAALPAMCPEALAREYSFNDEEREVLLHIGEAEAGNEGPDGIALVMNVVLNRSELWGMTVKDVVFEPGQFSPVGNGSYWKVPGDDCYRALEMVESGWDESEGSLYFCEGWFSWADYVKSFGCHNFFK